MDEQKKNIQGQDNYSQGMKFCKYCGNKIREKAIICPHCGCQVDELNHGAEQPTIVINNTNANTNTSVSDGGSYRKCLNKWVALLLCIFLGGIGAHKFYEGKIGMGILYLFTAGLFGIGWIIDIIVLILKPNPYYV